MLAIVQCNENEASSETETETKLPQGLVRGDWTNKDSPYLRLDVDLAETKAVTDVSIGFWVRFSTKDPKTVLVKDVRANRWYAAGVTEGKDWGGLSEKKNSLLHLSWWMDYV